jgi:hypothetical protein
MKICRGEWPRQAAPTIHLLGGTILGRLRRPRRKHRGPRLRRMEPFRSNGYNRTALVKNEVAKIEPWLATPDILVPKSKIGLRAFSENR